MDFTGVKIHPEISGVISPYLQGGFWGPLSHRIGYFYRTVAQLTWEHLIYDPQGPLGVGSYHHLGDFGKMAV